MIRRHVDLIAVGTLLFGAAVYSSTRNFPVIVPPGRITINNHFRSPRVVVPKIPKLPLVYATR